MFDRLKRARSILHGARSSELRANEVDVAITVNAIAAGEARIVDVRETHEWATGRIAGAIHMPLGELPRRARGLSPDRPVIAVCRSGRRSLVAANHLTALGFTDAKSLAGGMNAWREAGQPIER